MFRALLIGFLGLATPAFAQLKWDKPWQEFHRPPEDSYVEMKFIFHNVGTTPVTIKSVKPSCGCTTAHLDKKIYAPGETGELGATYFFGERKGAHHKAITVTTDDGAKEELNLIVFIHPALTLSQALVFWKVGQAADAQTVQVNAEPGTTVHVKSVASSNPRLSATFDPLKPGAQYAINVKPVDTTQREVAELTVQTDYPPDAPRAYTIHARIK